MSTVQVDKDWEVQGIKHAKSGGQGPGSTGEQGHEVRSRPSRGPATRRLADAMGVDLHEHADGRSTTDALLVGENTDRPGDVSAGHARPRLSPNVPALFADRRAAAH